MLLPTSWKGFDHTMPNPSSKWFKDAGERVVATGVIAGASMAITYLSGLDWVWAPVLTTLLTVVKTCAARYVGDSDSAALRKEN